MSTPPEPGPSAHSACDMNTQTDSPADVAILAGSASFDALMQAISTCQSTLNAKIDHELLLPLLLPCARFSPHFSIERPTRSTHIYFQTSSLSRLLREARIQGELKFENRKLLIFPDYSVETQ